jgi:polyhydroxybutyrate depolymerase
MLATGATAFAAKKDPGTVTAYLAHDGLKRKYIVHTPPSYNPANPTPLVLNFHGGGASAEGQMAFSEMNDKSDQAGFIVVYPEAPRKYKVWNIGPRDPNGVKDESPYRDVDFVRALIQTLKQKLNIDENRIYATGHSNGGFMTYRLACEMADTFAAVAPLSGNMFVPVCNPSRPISVLHLHGTGDLFVPYEGGPSSDKIPKFMRNSENIISTPALVDLWSRKNSCPAQSQVTFQKGKTTCVSYSPCAGGTEVALCTSQGAGHTWPGAVKYKEKRQGFLAKKTRSLIGETSEDIHANDVIWDFFTKHSRGTEAAR